MIFEMVAYALKNYMSKRKANEKFKTNLRKNFHRS
jgi:hypothetical protein